MERRISDKTILQKIIDIECYEGHLLDAFIHDYRNCCDKIPGGKTLMQCIEDGWTVKYMHMDVDNRNGWFLLEKIELI